MSPAIASPVMPAPAASNATAPTPATAAATPEDASAISPFVAELAAAAADDAMPAALEPATPETAPGSEDGTDAEAVSGLLNLILAIAPPPPPPAGAAAATPTAAVETAAAALPPTTPPLAAAAAWAPAAAPVAGEAVAVPAANDAAASFADLVALPPQSAPTLPPGLTVAASAAPTPPPPALSWPPLALDQPQWSRELGERLVWSTEEGLTQATIELHPQELGPIRVRIETEGDIASIALHAAHAATRELLAVSLPQLRELLNAQGLQLGRSQVGSTASASSDRDGARRGEDPTGSPLPPRRRWRVGLVDQYV